MYLFTELYRQHMFSSIGAKFLIKDMSVIARLAACANFAGDSAASQEFLRP